MQSSLYPFICPFNIVCITQEVEQEAKLSLG